MDVQKATISENSRSYTSVSLDKVFFNSPTPPLVLYYAFVSENQQDFTNDEFLCVSLVDMKNNELYVKSYGDLLIFYSSFRIYDIL